MHARMLQERQAGNNLTDEQLEAYIKERCVVMPPTPRLHVLAPGCGVVLARRSLYRLQRARVVPTLSYAADAR